MAWRELALEDSRSGEIKFAAHADLVDGADGLAVDLQPAGPNSPPLFGR
jgi:hypothetical protein